MFCQIWSSFQLDLRDMTGEIFVAEFSNETATKVGGGVTPKMVAYCWQVFDYESSFMISELTIPQITV